MGKTGFNPAPDDGTSARNCQDPTETIKITHTHTHTPKRGEDTQMGRCKEKAVWAKAYYPAQARGKLTPTDKSITLLSWGKGERGPSFFPAMKTAHTGHHSLHYCQISASESPFSFSLPSPFPCFLPPPQLTQTSSLTGR